MDHFVPMILKKGSTLATPKEKESNGRTIHRLRRVMQIGTHHEIQSQPIILRDGRLDGDRRNHGITYQDQYVSNLEYTLIVGNENEIEDVMKTSVHRCHAIWDEGMRGSDNQRWIIRSYI